MSVCLSGTAMKTLLAVSGSVCLHADGACYSIMHKNATFNLWDDRCRTADAIHPSAHGRHLF